MKRTLWIALLLGGVGLTALAQDTPDTAPVPEENALPPAADPRTGEELGPDPAPPAAPLVDDPSLPGSNPIDSDAPVDPLAPESDLLDDPNVPLTDPDDPLSQPIDPIPPARPGTARERLVDPRDSTPTDPLDTEPETTLDDPLRRPIESEPLAPSVNPLPSRREVPPPASQATPRNFDPAYGAPEPRRVQPQVELADVVRDPIRIYDARLLVLMGHHSAATKAIETLGNRFPTDARVQYLRFFQLSRSGDKDQALDALQQAIALERLYPMGDYNRFMEPLQGPDRFYAERVRRAAAELSRVDGLVEPDPDDYLPDADND